MAWETNANEHKATATRMLLHMGLAYDILTLDRRDLPIITHSEYDSDIQYFKRDWVHPVLSTGHIRVRASPCFFTQSLYHLSARI